MVVVAGRRDPAVAAPLLTLCSARLERRAVLVGLSALVVVSDVIIGLAPGIGVMLAARALLGVCVGGFWVFGVGAAITLVSERARGTAVAVVSSGIFLATVASLLEAGSLIGTLTTWRARVRGRAVFAVIAVAAQLTAVPAGRRRPGPARVAAAGGHPAGPADRPDRRGRDLLRQLRRLHLHRAAAARPEMRPGATSAITLVLLGFGVPCYAQLHQPASPCALTCGPP